jgi:hypothetical protein
MSLGLSTLTPRRRLLAMLRGEPVDHVPAIADLSWWHAAHGGGQFSPTVGGSAHWLPQLLDLHRRTGAAIHLNTGAFLKPVFRAGVQIEQRCHEGVFTHGLITPRGNLTERRVWSPENWSWGIERHLINSLDDLRLLRWAYEGLRYVPCWDDFRRVESLVGELGVSFVNLGYSGMGFLMSRYAGVEQTVMFSVDAPEELEQTVAVLNEGHARGFEAAADGPCDVLFATDNLSADVQSPPWFRRYSAAHYRRLAAIAHGAGKVVSMHIDGRLRGLLRELADCGIDAADAVTPAPWGDLTPQQCRDEAGDRLVLSGGVPPDSFAASVPIEEFDRQVQAWLYLRRHTGGLVIAPGDQLPPDGDLDRVTRMVQAAGDYN